LVNKKKNLGILSWIIIPYLLFSGVTNRSVRMTVAFLPAIAIIGSIALSKINKKFIITSIIAVFVIQTIIFNGFSITKLIVPKAEFPLDGTTEEDWKIKEILQFLNKSYNNRSLQVLVDKVRFNSINVQYYAYKNKYNFKKISGPTKEIEDLVIINTKSKQKKGSREEEFRASAEEFRKIKEQYQLVKEYYFPDKDIIQIYSKI